MDAALSWCRHAEPPELFKLEANDRSARRSVNPGSLDHGSRRNGALSTSFAIRAIFKADRVVEQRGGIFVISMHCVHTGVGSTLGSDAKLMLEDRQCSHRAKKASFEQIKTGAAIHLALHQLQFCVLPLGLAIRPWLGESRLHRGLILNDA